MIIEENIVSKILKLKELSERGVEGEMDNAKILLQKYLSKYNITLEEILKDKEKKEVYTFKYKSKFEKTILLQCIANLFGSKSQIWKSTYRYRNGKMEFLIELNKSEYIILKDFYEFHINEFNIQLKKMQDNLLSSYIYKQNLYDLTPSNNDSKESKISYSDLMSILNIASSMNTNQYRKSLKNGK